MTAPKTPKQAEDEVRSWGFDTVFTWTDGPLTTHLILEGALTITYPKDERPARETFGAGARIDVEAGRVHEVWMGKEGCTYVIGE